MKSLIKRMSAEFILAILVILFLSLGVLGISRVIAGRVNEHVTCANFTTQEDAQSYYEKNNAYWLDRDEDGIPCEALISKHER